ncbi:tetratricopeptide repeat protein [Halomonas alkalisoli]|uniref:tetratricopeptide repeat protein n=1 Tax=Halomonas alkalisoli TaxID=2907158 RepID=UPI001F3D5668|nr:sel1 repeat family protein [Halomonas alkalisoli]MCE9681293.1 sel1 repeat family protein [Halomonas alkalisoli]
MKNANSVANSMLIRKFLAIALLALSTTSWALEPEVQAAKDEGMRLYNIGHSTAALIYLRHAAEAGDVDAMYYMGEAERRQHMLGLTREAMAWYLKAAAEGDVYSMLQLFRGGACTAGDRCPDGHEDWHHAALAVAQPQAEAGDPDAMLALYHIYAHLDASRLTGIYNMLGIPTRAGKWLKRAAEAGLPEAQTFWGQQIRGGRGWYFTNGRRLATAEEWFRRAAEQGYVPGMSGLAHALIAQERYDEAWEWMQIASEHGHIEQRFGVGWCYLDPQRDGRCRNEVDKVKGWAILYSLAVETHYDLYKWAVRDHRDELTEEEVEEAEALAEAEWIGQHPPLSNFPPRFGY